MNFRFLRSRLSACWLAIASSAITSQLAAAATVTQEWDGSASSTFTVPANWSANIAPTASDIAQFSSLFTVSGNQPAIGANTTLAEIIFAGNLARSVTLSATAGTLQLDGVGSIGIANNSNQTVTISAPLRVGNDQSWQGNSMTISGTVDTNGKTLSLSPSSGQVFTLSNVISGSGPVTQTGAGTVVYSGSSGNSYSGNTTVNAGELQLNKSSGNAIAGNLTVGDGTGTDVVRLMASNQINDSSTLSTLSSGQLLFNGAYTESAASLTMTGGTVNTGSGSLTLTSDPAITSLASASTATIAGNVYLPGSKTISVANGAAAVDLDITANILDQWYTSITKTGAGTLRLSGTNTFQGPMVVNAGILIAASSGALGASNWGNTVASGAALQLTGGITLNEGGLEIGGTGTDGTGVLRSLSGNNTYNGTLTTTAATTITIDSGAGLTLSGSGTTVNFNHATTIANSGTFTTTGNSLNIGANVTFAGSGNSTISSNAITGSGTIIKTGTGTLLFNGSGSFSPSAMDIQQGTVELDRFFNPGTQTGLSIGTTAGPAATLKLLASDRLRDDLIVTIRESGTVNLDNKDEDIAGLTLYGGTVTTGTGTLTLANAGGDVINAQLSNQTATVTGKIQLAQDNLQQVTFTVADGSQTTDLNLNAAISQLNPSIQTLLVKNGTGTMEFSGTTANTYKGITRINAGTLKLNKTAGVDAIGGGTIELNSGGTLLLASAHQINNSVNLTMNGGTFSTGTTTGFSDKLGKMTLSANSIIDLGTGVHKLEFDASNSTTWSSGATLTIYDWVGAANSSGTQGQIFFGTNSSGLTSAQLAQISFNGFGVGAMLLANGELVPYAIPEAHVVVAALLLFGLLIWRERRFLLTRLTALKG